LPSLTDYKILELVEVDENKEEWKVYSDILVWFL
jgi:hypothetical protein